MQAMLLEKLKTSLFAPLLSIVLAGVWGLTYRSLTSDAQAGIDGQQTQPATPRLPANPPRSQILHKSPIMHAAWSPDGKMVATSTKDGTIHIHDVATGQEVQSFPAGNDVGAVAYSPDGKSLAVLSGGFLVGIWNTATGKHERNTTAGRGNVGAEHLAFTSDGQMVVGVGVAGSQGWFYRWQTNGGKVSYTVSGSGPGRSFSAIAPDGLVCGWCDAKGACHAYAPANVEFSPGRKAVSLKVGNCECIAFGPGAKFLAVGNDDKTVQLWDLGEKKVVRVLKDLATPAAKLSFSADGKTLAAVAGKGRTIRVWDLMRNTTGCQINHVPGEVGVFVLSPDSKMLATTSKDGKVLFLWPTTARQLSNSGPSLKLSQEELGTLWADLSNPDCEKIDFAWRTLGAAGDSVVTFLAQQIRPIAMPAVDLKRIEKLVAALDSEKYAIREQAGKELMTVGELAIVPLQRLLEKPTSPEGRERANLLLKKFGVPSLTPEHQRVLLAIDLLYQLRSVAAIELLQEIERDALIPQIRTEAHKALQRIKR
jgi:WD40 repeat protein